MNHPDDQLGQHEAELHDLLERTVSSVPVPVGLAPSALQHGRRLRTRRRVGLTAGFAAGTAAAAVAAALIVPSALGGGSASSIYPAGGPTSATSSEPPEPPARADWPAGWWDMPTVDMVSAVTAILPDGVRVRSSGPLVADTPEGGPATGHAAPILVGPTGPGAFYLNLLPGFMATESPTPVAADDARTSEPTLPGGGDLFCADNLSTRVQCEVLHAPDGNVIGRRSTVTSDGVTSHEVVLKRDGGLIIASVTDGLISSVGGSLVGTADEPPLTLDQLEDLVRNDTWVMPAT